MQSSLEANGISVIYLNVAVLMEPMPEVCTSQVVFFFVLFFGIFTFVYFLFYIYTEELSHFTENVFKWVIISK